VEKQGAESVIGFQVWQVNNNREVNPFIYNQLAPSIPSSLPPITTVIAPSHTHV